MDDRSTGEILAEFGPDGEAVVRELLPRVYQELRQLAAAHLGEERAGHTLQPTALVHEVYVRLSGAPAGPITDRAHFFRLASKVMRQILVDHARARAADKRGGGRPMLTLDASMWHHSGAPVDLLSLDDAMCRLEQMDKRMARLVELRFYGGLSEDEAADALSISRTQAAREWRTARAWLASELQPGSGA